MTTADINHKVASYLARIAQTLEDLGTCDPGFGEFYVSEVSISFGGEPTQYAVAPDEFGGYSILIKD